MKYITNDELRETVIEYQNNPSDLVMNKWVNQCYLVGKKLLSGRNYSGYSIEDKEDMIQNAVIKLYKAINNVDANANIHAFITTAFINTIRTEMQKYSKHKTIQTQVNEMGEYWGTGE